MVLVIFLFLGSLRATLVPGRHRAGVAGRHVLRPRPVFGCSINLLTLLALVLPIGLVVDDAIVVLENIARRIRAR